MPLRASDFESLASTVPPDGPLLSAPGSEANSAVGNMRPPNLPTVRRGLGRVCRKPAARRRIESGRCLWKLNPADPALSRAFLRRTWQQGTASAGQGVFCRSAVLRSRRSTGLASTHRAGARWIGTESSARPGLEMHGPGQQARPWSGHVSQTGCSLVPPRSRRVRILDGACTRIVIWLRQVVFRTALVEGGLAMAFRAVEACTPGLAARRGRAIGGRYIRPVPVMVGAGGSSTPFRRRTGKACILALRRR